MARIGASGRSSTWSRPRARSVPGTQPRCARRRSTRSRGTRFTERAAEKSGVDESVITGEGTLEGRRVGDHRVRDSTSWPARSASRRRADRELHRARHRRGTADPGLPTSGGTRMQEGTIAFLQMVKISRRGRAQVRRPALPRLPAPPHDRRRVRLVGLASARPVAEPGALIGSSPPRVRGPHDAPFPEGVRSPENLAERGMIDGVLPPEGVRDLTARARVLCQDPPPATSPPPHGPSPEHRRTTTPGVQHRRPDAWDSITRSRRPDRRRPRPAVRVLPDRVRSRAPARARTAAPPASLARFRGSPPSSGPDRDAESEKNPLGPSSLRSARRGMDRRRDRCPPGPAHRHPRRRLSREAEEGGWPGRSRAVSPTSSPCPPRPSR